MKEPFLDIIRLSKFNVDRLKMINKIIDEYRSQGYTLTLRQLYYQLVSRGIILNKSEEYAKLSVILVRGRMAGIIDWESIEDRIRVPKIPYYVHNVPDAFDDMIRSYRLDRLKDQDVYIEVWVEKDALSGVLSRVTDEYHIRLMVNRGYSSATAMYDAAKRFILNSGKSGHILYLGDHDPSGMDMVRDIRERIKEFGADVNIHHIALTDEQIKKYNPPPNPAKIKDPRAKAYIAKYGRTSWEVDALKPEILNTLLKTQIDLLIDHKKYNNMVNQEKLDKEEMLEFRVQSEKRKL